MIPATAILFITNEEGCKLVPYQDVTGRMTIGVGHLCLASEHPFASITQQQSDALLAQDLAFADKCIERNVRVPLTDNQRTALLSWIFNLGCKAILESTLLRRLNEGNYALAAAEFPRWCYAGGRRYEGLYKRRIKEQALFCTV